MKFLRWLVRVSIVVNYVLTGNKNKPICASIYEWRLEKPSFLSKAALECTDRLFWFDKQHCRRSYVKWRFSNARND